MLNSLGNMYIIAAEPNDLSHIIRQALPNLSHTTNTNLSFFGILFHPWDGSEIGTMFVLVKKLRPSNYRTRDEKQKRWKQQVS